MTFLPVVVRELRAAVHRPSTFRLRCWTAILAAIITCGALLLLGLSRPRGAAGGPLFAILTHYAFGLCLLAGSLLTADCLSREKREGTLGLLFLTELNGYDVALGKFAATSLNALYGLFALLPILGLPVLLGGVTGAEFWRVALALANALFFSLCAGLCVSAFAREAQGAMAGTLVLTLLVTAALPALARLGPLTHASPLWTCAAWPSPFHAFSYASEVLFSSGSKEYWGGLITAHMTGWLGLAVASLALGRQWQDTPANAAARDSVRRWWQSDRGNRDPLRRQLSSSPVLWLIGTNRTIRFAAWSVVGVWGVVVVAGSCLAPAKEPFWAYQGAKMTAFVLKMLIAFEACRFFVQAREDRTMELLLCTPVRTQDILDGQWQALRALFLPPLTAFLLLNLAPIVALAVAHPGGPQAARLASAVAGFTAGLMALGWLTFTLVADAFAVCWFGMWLALSMKRPTFAPAVTLLAVLVVPSFFCFLDLVADLVFILWGYTQLQQDFRRRLSS